MALDIDIIGAELTLNIDIVAQSVGNISVDIAAQAIGNLSIDIAAQSVGNLSINLAASAITLDINIATSAVTLDMNIATCAATLDISVIAQEIDLDINLEGPTGGYAVEIGSDFTLYQQPYSRRAQVSTTGADVECTADTRYTLTNSTHFYNPIVELYCSAACTITIECMIGTDYYVVGEIPVTTGGRSVRHLRDIDGNVLHAWRHGSLYYTPDTDTTIRFRLGHLP